MFSASSSHLELKGKLKPLEEPHSGGPIAGQWQRIPGPGCASVRWGRGVASLRSDVIRSRLLTPAQHRTQESVPCGPQSISRPSAAALPFSRCHGHR